MTVLHSLGQQLLDDGEFEVALSAYDAGIQEYGGRFCDYHNRARLHRILGNCDAALLDHETALHCGPMDDEDRALLHQGRAFTHLFLGNTNHAIGDLITAMELSLGWVVQASLWIHELRTTRGNPGDDHAAARSLQTARRAALSMEEKLITHVYTGRQDIDEALDHVGGDPHLECALLYYRGAWALNRGDVAGADVWFTRALESLGHGQPEFDLAAWHLQK